jgi:hypothetical protein
VLPMVVVPARVRVARGCVRRRCRRCEDLVLVVAGLGSCGACLSGRAR